MVQSIDTRTKHILELIQSKYGLDYDELVDCVVHGRELNTVDDEQLQMTPDVVNLDYVVIDNSEYLYDQRTRHVYSYSKRPHRIGKYSVELETIIRDA